MRTRVLASAVALLATTACGPRTAPDDEAAGAPAGALVSSLDILVEGDTVEFALHVTNVSDAPLELEYPTLQRYDFEVRSVAGEVVWGWASDRAFGQVQGTERLEPGESRTYRASWDAAGQRVGRYIAVGRLVSANVPTQLEATFELPAGGAGGDR